MNWIGQAVTVGTPGVEVSVGVPVGGTETVLVALATAVVGTVVNVDVELGGSGVLVLVEVDEGGIVGVNVGAKGVFVRVAVATVEVGVTEPQGTEGRSQRSALTTTLPKSPDHVCGIFPIPIVPCSLLLRLLLSGLLLR